MLHAKKEYIKHMVPREKGATKLTVGLPSDALWLHNRFNRDCLQRAPKETFNGVRVIDCPSKYKVDKAVRILKRYAMVPAISRISKEVDAETSAVFYYAALILEYADGGTSMYEISPGQNEIVNKALVVAESSMEKGHQWLITVGDDIVDKLIKTLVDANARCKELYADWNRHMDTRTNGSPYGENKEV